MNKTVSIFDYIKKLEIDMPSEEEFKKLSQRFPINPSSEISGEINFERGMLLYAIIALNKPKTIVEIGTAGGYSTLCMAWAMADFNINGKIITIDPKSHDEKMEGINLSRKELWEKFANKEWIKKINVITGFSNDVLTNSRDIKIDFAYIDGSHFFEAVKNDFFLILKLVSNEFQILLDDYYPEDKFGVKKVVDEELNGKFDIVYIKTNTKKQYEEIANRSSDDMIMCYIDSKSLTKPLWEIFSKEATNKFLKDYNRVHNRIIMRKKLEKKIPFFKNIKFRWWIKH